MGVRLAQASGRNQAVGTSVKQPGVPRTAGLTALAQLNRRNGAYVNGTFHLPRQD